MNLDKMVYCRDFLIQSMTWEDPNLSTFNTPPVMRAAHHGCDRCPDARSSDPEWAGSDSLSNGP